MIRQIILDTETTGLDPFRGDRIVEIGCLEMIDRTLTGRNFHVYINPERAMSEEAFKVHGLSDDFLSDKPIFSAVAQHFIEFVGGSELIIHNASFDMKFLDYELSQCNLSLLTSQCAVLDTLLLAKELHPGQRNNLDALCKRYEIDNSNRSLHGALLDAELLAEVYLRMTGGQSALSFHEEKDAQIDEQVLEVNTIKSTYKSKVIFANTLELSEHELFMKKILK